MSTTCTRFVSSRMTGFSVSIGNGRRRVHRQDLVDDEPVAERPDRRQVLLDGRHRPRVRPDAGRHAERRDRPQLEPARRTRPGTALPPSRTRPASARSRPRPRRTPGTARRPRAPRRRSPRAAPRRTNSIATPRRPRDSSTTFTALLMVSGRATIFRSTVLSVKDSGADDVDDVAHALPHPPGGTEQRLVLSDQVPNQGEQEGRICRPCSSCSSQEIQSSSCSPSSNHWCNVSTPVATLLIAFPMLCRTVSMTSRRPWAKACVSASSSIWRAVTSRKTATPPTTSPASLRTGLALTLMYTPSRVFASRTKSRWSSTVSPPAARTSGSWSVGTGSLHPRRTRRTGPSTPLAADPSCRCR